MEETAQAAPLLALRDLRVDYSGLQVVRGVSLTVGPGEILGVVGALGGDAADVW